MELEIKSSIKRQLSCSRLKNIQRIFSTFRRFSNCSDTVWRSFDKDTNQVTDIYDLRVQLCDGLHRGTVNDRLDLAQILVHDQRFTGICRRYQTAARWRHKDASEVSGVVEPGAVQVVLRAGRSTTVQLYTYVRLWSIYKRFPLNDNNRCYWCLHSYFQQDATLHFNSLRSARLLGCSFIVRMWPYSCRLRILICQSIAELNDAWRFTTQSVFTERLKCWSISQCNVMCF